jgi:ABC-type transport system substrate-binding protein
MGRRQRGIGVTSAEPVLIPVGGIRRRLDNDSPDYVFSPDTYMTLGLAYEAMAAPDAVADADGVLQPDFSRLQPRMATSWSEQPDGDWIVELRPGMRSHAGNEWTAEDLAWVFEKAFAEGVMASWRWRGVVGVREVTVLGRHTVRFSLRSPYPTFSNWLMSVSPNMVDSVEIRSHVTPSDPWGVSWLDEHVAGYGAYQLDEMTDGHLLFTARPDYWGPSPEATKVEVAKFADRHEAISQLRQDRPALVVGTDPDETTALLAEDDLQVVRIWGGHVSVEIDFTETPFDDARVRQALALATPSEQIRTEGLLGMGRPWRSPVKKPSQWYLDAATDDFSLKQARDLLATAGHANGIAADFYIERFPYCERIAEIIADAWRQIGVELTIRDIEKTTAGWLPPLSLRTECGHNVTEPVYDIAHDYAAMNPLLPLPGGPEHVGNWWPRWKKNPEALRRFAALLEAPDSTSKRQQTEDIQRFLAGFGSSIFIAEMQQVIAANRRVPASMIASDSRFLHALGYQNPKTNYLPAR